MSTEQELLEKPLHEYARVVAETLSDPDKKHLRYNDIVKVALDFYQPNPMAGVRELVEACDKSKEELYDKKVPMWSSLRVNYSWMISTNNNTGEKDVDSNLPR